MSSPLILSFNLSDPEKMDRVWPIITNRAVIAVNQRWAGSPGRRITLSDGWQAWAKPMSIESYAVFLMNTGGAIAQTALSLANVSTVFSKHTLVCIRDLYKGVTLPPIHSGVPLADTILAHDSRMYCIWPNTDGNCQNPTAAHCP